MQAAGRHGGRPLHYGAFMSFLIRVNKYAFLNVLTGYKNENISISYIIREKLFMNNIWILFIISSLCFIGCDLKNNNKKKSGGTEDINKDIESDDSKDEDSDSGENENISDEDLAEDLRMKVAKEIYKDWSSRDYTVGQALGYFQQAKQQDEDREHLDSVIQALVSYSKDQFPSNERNKLFAIADDTISLRTEGNVWQPLQFDEDDRRTFLYALKHNSQSFADQWACLKNIISLNYVELAAFWGYDMTLAFFIEDSTNIDMDSFLNSPDSVPLAFATNMGVANTLVTAGAKLDTRVRRLADSDTKMPWIVLSNLKYIKAPQEVINFIESSAKAK
jgi:hypothetical protein